VPNGLTAAFAAAGRRRFLLKSAYAAWFPLQYVTRLHRMTLSRNTPLVAVTGSFGKTTTTRAISVALGLPDHPWIGYSLNAFSFQFVHLCRQSRHPFAVLEVGIGAPGQMSGYARALRPDVAVVTSIGSEHLKAFANMDALADEKAEIVRDLPPTATAVVNADDPHVVRIGEQTRAQKITFGLRSGRDVSLRSAETDWPNGTELTIDVLGRVVSLRTRLVGRTMIYPVLAALATAVALGRDQNEALARLETLSPTPGRLQPMLLPNGATVLRDDRKAAVETIHAALDLFQELPAKRRLFVCGDISDPPEPQETRYAEVGRHAAQVADRVVIVGTDTWKFDAYRRGYDDSATPSSPIRFAAGVEDVPRVLGEIGPGDVLLVKGRRREKLTRAILSLSGQAVRCRVPHCTLSRYCEQCQYLGQDRKHE
jgi:UDP-N-acetylmuramoyl-tripeptide--D-alanyl-D-alanine ligase